MTVMQKFGRRAIVALALSVTTLAAQAAPLRVGYWTSGVSLGLGAVLEKGDFLQKAGIKDVQFVHLSDVNAPTTALAANAIDIGFGVAAASLFSIAANGVPVKIIAASTPAAVDFVVPADSPITSLSQLKGKKLGMSPAGSSVEMMAAAILQGNYGLAPGDYSEVGGNEGRLAQFVVQHQVDVAALRTVTIAQLGQQLKTRTLATFPDEWKRLTKSNALPYLGVGAVRSDVLQKDPKVGAEFIVAVQRAIDWGNKHPDQIAKILEEVGRLPAADAKAYATHWAEMNAMSMTPDDVQTLKLEYQIFAKGGALKGSLPNDVFVTAPYQQAVQILKASK